MSVRSRSLSKRGFSKRGFQLASATVLGLVTTFLVAGVIALGLYQAHKTGPGAWLRAPGAQEVQSSCVFHFTGTRACFWVPWP